MTYIKNTFPEFLTTIEGFEQLPDGAIANLSEQLQAWRYRIGQKSLVKKVSRNASPLFMRDKCASWDTIPRRKCQLP